MKKFIFLFIVIGLAACADDWHGRYDGELCSELAVKIESRQPISQQEYTQMIAQNEDILKYIIERSNAINELPDSSRAGAWRDLLADPDYLERFGYMFTLGSALYQASTDSLLDKDNISRYAELDRYNADLAAITDRN